MGSSAPSRQDCIGFKDAAFSWSNLPAGGTQTPSGRGFRLRIEDELLFKKNAINLIIGKLTLLADVYPLLILCVFSGPTGSGKTSLLMALLGEMHYIPSKPGSWFSLPRLGGVAYAPQESWVLNTTIRASLLSMSLCTRLNFIFRKTLFSDRHIMKIATIKVCLAFAAFEMVGNMHWGADYGIQYCNNARLNAISNYSMPETQLRLARKA